MSWGVAGIPGGGGGVCVSPIRVASLSIPSLQGFGDW